MSKQKVTHSKDFDKRPLLFRVTNAIWKATYPIGTRVPLDKDDLIRAARKKTGLTDLGKDFWDEPLERLLIAVNEEARLHPVGRFITRQRFISLLSIRLRANNYFSRFPQILDQPLYPAWIIIGLQRTGTTKLHRTLATDPAHRVIPSWEVINPIPLTFGKDDFKKRVAVARTAVRALKLMSPGFFAIHPIEINQPEEDILLLDVSFISTTPEAMMYVPSYASWLEQTDQVPAYDYAVKLLKFLQWQRPATRWVLKSPHHLEFLGLIEKTFEAFHFLWPHRNIYESVPSFLSMVTYNHMVFSDDVDKQKVAEHWVRKTGYMLDRALDFREKSGNESKFTDIFYKDLVNDPLPELSRIYKHNGGLTPELISRFVAYDNEYPRSKYGSHVYSLADFDLTDADIDKYSERYKEFFARLYGNK